MPYTPRLPRLLLVEDSDEDAATMSEALDLSGLAADLHRVTSGDACLELLREEAAPQPVLVIMDLNTPGIDGRAALVLIKTDARLKKLPVIVVSTSGNPRDVEFCFAAGANAYHLKPVRYPEHLRNMADLLTYWLGKVTLPAHAQDHP
jgi:CheY-like chemotaxis protein